MTLLKLEIQDTAGNRDISVTSQNATNYPSLNWAFPDLPATRIRNTCFIPFKLSNPGSEPWVAKMTTTTGEPGTVVLNLNEHPDKFVTWDLIPMPMLKGSMYLAVMDEMDNVVREANINVPFTKLVKPSGEVRLEPGEAVHAHFKMALLDKTMLANGKPWSMWAKFDAFNVTDANAQIWLPIKFGSGQMRAGADVDIP